MLAEPSFRWTVSQQLRINEGPYMWRDLLVPLGGAIVASWLALI